jgi:hypothetical protein
MDALMATGECSKSYIAVFLPACMLFAIVKQAIQNRPNISTRRAL